MFDFVRRDGRGSGALVLSGRAVPDPIIVAHATDNTGTSKKFAVKLTAAGNWEDLSTLFIPPVPIAVLGGNEPLGTVIDADGSGWPAIVLPNATGEGFGAVLQLSSSG